MNLDRFFSILKNTKLKKLESSLKQAVDAQLSGLHKESLKQWEKTIDAMPDISIKECMLNEGIVSAVPCEVLDDMIKKDIETGLRALNPWRKGPFNIAGVYIDSEWRSDMKWARLKDKIEPLKGRTVLDVGCGNGYHCFRAVGNGAEVVLGIDHKVTFFGQNQALLKYLRTDRTAVIPMGVDDFPDDCNIFDTVFSMGVIYHVHSPKAHLRKLKNLLGKGGELVLETLVIDDKFGDVLVPHKRYARMPNVRSILSVGTIMRWMQDCGFDDVRLIDKTKTTKEEQHRTSWGVKQSLEDFLDSEDKNKTIEGYPAPQRAIFLAHA